MGASEKVYKLCLHNLYTFERADAGFLASGGKLVDEPALAS
jgi:hypothetical protein